MPDRFEDSRCSRPVPPAQVAGPARQWVGLLLAFAVFAVTPAGVLAEEVTAMADPEVVLPAAPTEAALLPFEVSATTDYRFAIDGQSLRVPVAGMVQYTVVIDSPAGARTVSHEAIRCASGQVRRYAVGRRDGQWSQIKQSTWAPIDATKVVNRYHAALFYDHFCRDGLPSYSADEARASLLQAARR